MSSRAQHDGADVVIVNTCGFLDSAKAESLDAIGEALAENGKVIVTGCMGAEPEKITERYPDVLADHRPAAIRERASTRCISAAPPAHDPFLDLVPPEGIKLTPRHYAYLKISEGCNNRCTLLHHPEAARRPRLAPGRRRAARGRAAGRRRRQGTAGHLAGHLGLRRRHQICRRASWQRPRGARPNSSISPRALGELGVWVRLHYVYPYPHVDEVIPLMAEGKILPYLDIPFQHASPDVLKRMRRPGRPGEDARAHPALARDLPGPHASARPSSSASRARPRRISSSCSTGSTRPQLDRVGCFRYEPVAGAAANDLAAPVPDEVKEERWHRFMERQQAISARRLKRKVGTRQQVIIDEVGPTVAKGRSKGDAPEIDGTVYVASRRPLRVGEIATVKIERADAYDLHGTAVGF